MKQFNFSLNTLLKVKSLIFEKDAIHLSLLQKELQKVLIRQSLLQEQFEEMVEASIVEPSLRGTIESLQEKIERIDQEIILSKRKIMDSQKSLSESYQRRKVVEKIRENQYALYQKECARVHERQNSLIDRTL